MATLARRSGFSRKRPKRLLKVTALLLTQRLAAQNQMIMGSDSSGNLNPHQMQIGRYPAHGKTEQIALDQSAKLLGQAGGYWGQDRAHVLGRVCITCISWKVIHVQLGR